ncbi:MAG: hypothetical protein KY475_19585 [Planctomycetes bacterium]|nr:hypothetical protein [Planctomycetota bacterium]
MTVPPQDRRPALRPPQFRLSTLLWVVALMGAVLAAMNLVGPIGAFALALFILSVVAHVSGNALGTRLRRLGDEPVDDDDRPVHRRPQFGTGNVKPGPRPRLGEYRRMGLLLAIVVVASVALGAGGGVWWTLRTGQPAPTIQDLALAATAFGVLGGIWGFITGGFLLVGAGAVREAMQAPKQSDPS